MATYAQTEYYCSNTLDKPCISASINPNPTMNFFITKGVFKNNVYPGGGKIKGGIRTFLTQLLGGVDKI